MKAVLSRTTIVCFLLIAFASVSAAIASVGKNTEKATGPEGRAKAPDLEVIEFIHWKKDVGKAKPERCDSDGVCEPGEDKKTCPDCQDGGGEEPPSEPTNPCYAFIGQYGKTYLKWRELPVDYVINPDVPDYFHAPLVLASDEWDFYTPGVGLFGSIGVLPSAVPYGVLDGNNAICYGDNYSNPDVIAVCKVWYNPATKAIAEFDITFETDWDWGVVTYDEPLMDVQNIATHELGHALGLADVYDAACIDVTMYGYSGYGDTDKRSLEDPDKEAIAILYP